MFIYAQQIEGAEDRICAFVVFLAPVVESEKETKESARKDRRENLVGCSIEK